MKVIKFVHPKWTNYFLKKLDSQILDVGPMFDRNLNFFLNWCRLFQTPMPCVHLKLSNCHWDILNKIYLSLYLTIWALCLSIFLFYISVCSNVDLCCCLSFISNRYLIISLKSVQTIFFCQNRQFQNDFFRITK
jgi:hypothetical protein